MSAKADYITPAFITSLVLHLIFGWSVTQTRLTDSPKIKVIDVDLVNFTAPIKKQIITPTNQPKIEPKETTKYLSDRDQRAEKEQIKRGNPEAGTPGAQANARVKTPSVSPQTKQNNKSTPPQNKPNTSKSFQATKKLDLSTNYNLLSNLAKKKPKQQNTNQATDQAQPFSRAPGSSARVFGYHGSLDYLPQVTDGDITLLNAKADKFAVFVRRVAIRVFNLLKQYGWDYLTARDFVSLNQFTTIRATLDPQGKFKALTIETSSGNTSFDRVTERSVSEGANDPNPPVAAKADDGNYRFIFQTRAWSQSMPATRHSPMQERRWLMLQTGLE